MNTVNQENIAKDFLKSFLNNPTAEKIEETPVKKVEEYRDLPITNLPMHKLYHPNLRVQFRALDVGEIQSYSTLETNDVNLVRPKLDEILNKTVKVSMPRQKLSYKNLFVNDRMYLIYTLREITFQNGKVLSQPVKCSNPACKHDFEIELTRQNLELWPEDQEIWQYFKPEIGCFVFETTLQDEPYYLRPPTIGLQESFYNWIQDQQFKKKEVSQIFVKIAPYTTNATELSLEEMTELQEGFINALKEKAHAREEFQFLNDAIDSFKNNTFKLGIRGMMKHCPMCGTEVRTSSVFPKRARDLFVIPNAFRHYLKK